MKHRIWIALALAPLTFLSLLSMDRAVGGPIPVPFVLMTNHALVFALVVRWMRADGVTAKELGWRPSVVDVLVGAGAGVGIWLASHHALSRVADALATAARGVDAGFLLPMAPSRSRVAAVGMFVHAVIVAPIVEETIYRAYGITVLGRRHGATVAVLVSSLFFGVLHVRLGLAAILQTALAAVLFGGLFLWRRSVVAAVVAHAVANLPSFLGH